jgi:hypothetical protein
MPGNFLQADTSFPELSKYESTEAKLDAIQNYLFLLLENLRYTLRNLSMEDNFNQADLGKWVDGLDIEANTIVSNTVITNELYSEYGAIADLAVDRLRTDYKRAKRYLQGNTAAIDYISIHDEEISFLTGTVKYSETTGLPLTEQLHDGDRYFWWKDEVGGQMTSLEETDFPVTVFRYDELVKARFHFETIQLAGGGTTRIPVLIFGAGFTAADDPTGTRGKARFFKDETSMNLVYRNGAGVDTGVYMNDDGFTDVTQRRASVAVDTAQHTITVTPEGDAGRIVIEYVEDADGNLTLRWPDAKTFTVSVT